MWYLICVLAGMLAGVFVVACMRLIIVKGPDEPEGRGRQIRWTESSWLQGTGETCLYSIGQKCRRRPPVACADGKSRYPSPTHGVPYDGLCPCAEWKPKEQADES